MDSTVDMLLSYFDNEKEQHFTTEPLTRFYNNFKAVKYLFVRI